MEKKTKEVAGVTFTGDITVMGDMFNIHDNQNVHITMQGETKKEEPEALPRTKEAIMEYVGRLKPVVREELIAHYDELWRRILELREVKMLIYHKGKQQDTTFNRNLVAQIIHQLGERVYAVGVSDQQFAEYLEPGKGKNHSVRQKLGESPEGPVKKAVEMLLVKE